MGMESAEHAASAASAAGGAISTFAQLIGIKAALGMAGAVLLFLGAPPERPRDGSHSKVEFITRLAVAGFCSALLGDWFVDLVNGLAPWLMAAKHPAPFWLAAGAPGWWVSRWVALQLYKWKDKTAFEVIGEVRKAKPADPLDDQATGTP